MASQLNKNNVNSWTKLKGSDFHGESYFVESIIYSPQNRTGLAISTIKVQEDDDYNTRVVFRVIDMATGEIQPYTVRRKFERDIQLITYYYLTETQIVLVTYDPDCCSYIQQLYEIDDENNRIHSIGYARSTPAYAPSDKSGVEDFVTNPIEGCQPTVIDGKKFLILPAATGLVLLLWNSLSLRPSFSSLDNGIYIIFSTSWKFEDYIMFEYWFYTFGSMLYFPVCTQNSLGNLRDNFDRFAVIDLAGIDLNLREIVLKNETAKFTMVHLKNRSEGKFSGMQKYRFSQRGKFVIAAEMKNITNKSRTRPAVKSRVYIMNLESLETTLVWTRLRIDCHLTLFNSLLLIWRSRFVSNLTNEDQDNQNEELQLSKVIYEYKTAPLTGLEVPSLYSLAKNSLMFGRNGITLPQLYIDRFF